MGSFADYLENKILDHIFGGGDFTRPATVYIGLSTTTVTDAGGNITEPSGNGYARVAVTNNATNFPAASGGSKSNGTTVAFPQASGNWITVTDFFISDASSSGNILGYGALSASKTVGVNDTASFAPGALTMSIN